MIRLSLILVFLVSCSHFSSYKKVCLNGHEYWSKGPKLAIVLDDGGKPIRCECRSCIKEFNKNMDKTTKNLIIKTNFLLTLLDKGYHGKFWEKASPLFKKSITKKDWIKKSKKVRGSLGKFISRMPSDARINKSGDATIYYSSKFENFPLAKEVVHFSKIKGEWLLDGVWVK